MDVCVCISNAELVISRVYRGHLARRRCRRLREQDRSLKRDAILNYYAVIIQKSLRGMHSRRHKLDIRIRKAYVTEIATKGDEIRRRLAENLRQQQLVCLFELDSLGSKSICVHIWRQLSISFCGQMHIGGATRD